MGCFPSTPNPFPRTMSDSNNNCTNCKGSAKTAPGATLAHLARLVSRATHVPAVRTANNVTAVPIAIVVWIAIRVMIAPIVWGAITVLVQARPCNTRRRDHGVCSLVSIR
ncbi:hypothetical protein HBI23_105490 [Parastagonospora nodorum]|nr:hypothetical protein HBI23_105490 [Parastagonospora nodorum]